MSNDNKQVLPIRCEKLTLLWSNFKQEDAQTEESYSKFDFAINAEIFTDSLISKLDVKLVNQVVDDEKKGIKQTLEFCIGLLFLVNQEMKSQEMADFAKMNSITILWPYAREFASDILNRSGVPFPILPIINPQVMTEKLNKKELIKVTIHDQELEKFQQ